MANQAHQGINKSLVGSLGVNNSLAGSLIESDNFCCLLVQRLGLRVRALEY